MKHCFSSGTAIQKWVFEDRVLPICNNFDFKNELQCDSV